jgi:glycine C-acetyltransferase
MGRVDIITGTLGKALGGASGGYTAALLFILMA